MNFNVLNITPLPRHDNLKNFTLFSRCSFEKKIQVLINSSKYLRRKLKTASKIE